jgi:Uma2 family endonuclease
MIAEILSFSTAKYDTVRKFKIYEAVGIREYWIVYPSEGIETFLLQPDGKYDSGTRYKTGKVPVYIFNGL